MLVPLDVGLMAVQHRDLAEPRAKALFGLRGEADFRHQHDRLPPEVQHLLNGLDVDFGLAAARDAVHQDRLVPARLERGQDRAERRFLVGIERQVRLPAHRRLDERAGVDPLRFARQQSPFAQGPDRGQRAADGLGDRSWCQRLAGGGQVVENLPLLGRQLQLLEPVGHARRQAHENRLPSPGLPANSGRHDGLQHLRPGAQVIVGHPARQPQHARTEQAAPVDDVRHRLQLAPATERLSSATR